MFESARTGMMGRHTDLQGKRKYRKSSNKRPGEDSGRLFEVGAYLKRGAYLIFPKSWPDMITFLIAHNHQNKLFIDVKNWS